MGADTSSKSELEALIKSLSIYIDKVSDFFSLKSNTGVTVSYIALLSDKCVTTSLSTRLCFNREYFTVHTDMWGSVG